jgi:CHAT domain-containing protein
LLTGLVSNWDTYQKLIIIPDGPLNALPFSVLTLPGSEAPLVLSHEVSYAPSMSVYQQLHLQDNVTTTIKNALVVADPLLDEHSTSPGMLTGLPQLSLPFANKEAQNIQAISGLKTRLFSGDTASKSSLISQNMGSFDILHFATHGIASDQHPLMSGLILSNANEANHVLLSPEIHQLDLHASLVFLSACETAIGPIFNGEGMAGLSRSFLAAGAKNVIASHWQVQDDATARLVQYFYHNLLVENMSASKALKEAQKFVRNYRLPNGQAPWREPYYWAAFTLLGAGKLQYDRTI